MRGSKLLKERSEGVTGHAEQRSFENIAAASEARPGENGVCNQRLYRCRRSGRRRARVPANPELIACKRQRMAMPATASGTVSNAALKGDRLTVSPPKREHRDMSGITTP